jgi:hypothetical protein
MIDGAVVSLDERSEGIGVPPEGQADEVAVFRPRSYLSDAGCLQ